MKNTCGIYLYDITSRKILLVHPTNHAPDFWSIPKGINDEGEAVMDAAIRELKEETNIDLLKLQLHPKVCEFNPIQYKKKHKTLCTILVGVEVPHMGVLKCESYFELKGRQIPECDNWWWASLDEAKKVLHETQVSQLGIVREFADHTFHLGHSAE